VTGPSFPDVGAEGAGRSEPARDPLLASRQLRRRFGSIHAAAVAGIICATGWSAALAGLLSAPGIGASDEDIVAYYADTSASTAALVWVQVMVFATIAFLWFVGVVRGRLGDREPKLFGTVFFGASILLAGLLFVGASFLAAPAVLVSVGGRAPAPDVVALTRAAAAVVLSVFAPRVATLVMFATAGLGRATGALPPWLVWLTYLVGAVEFVNVTVAVPTIYVMPAWVAVVSVVLLVRRPPQGFDLDPGPTTA
jgi:hypothetical protein